MQGVNLHPHPLCYPHKVDNTNVDNVDDNRYLVKVTKGKV